MTTTQLRREMKKRVDTMSEDELHSLADYVQSMDEPADPAREDAERQARFMQRLAQAEADIAAGRKRNWREIRSDV